MRILLIPLSGGEGLGPLTRCLAVGREASSRGHNVAILCRKEFIKWVKPYGFKYFEAPSPVLSGITMPPYRLCDVAIELGWVGYPYFEEAIETERKVIQTFKPDVIFSEMQLTVPISSKVEGIPWAASTNWGDHPQFNSPLYPNVAVNHEYDSRINKTLAKYNLPPIDDICDLAFLSADLKIAATTPELQPDLSIVPNVHYIGDLISPDIEERKLPKEIEKWGSNRKMIYVYLSPGDLPSDVWIPTIIKAFKDTEFNVIVTLAPLTLKSEELPNIPNIKFFVSLPGRAAIQRSDLVITHGGGNTVNSALLYSKPLMIFSHFYAERDYNGIIIENLGAGMNFRSTKFTTSSLLSNARKLLSDKSYERNARRLGNEIRKLGGRKRAIDLIEKLIQRK